MLKKTIISLLVVSVLFTMVVTPLWGEEPRTKVKEDGPVSFEKLFTYISQVNPYKSWGTWPGEVERASSSRKHGPYVTKYLNATALAALSDSKGIDSLPYGSIIVQENFSSWGLSSISVMYKVKMGYNPDANDWFFANYTTKGNSPESGRGASCLSCHKSARDTDFLLTDFSVGRSVAAVAIPLEKITN